jgi:hypothetical protein
MIASDALTGLIVICLFCALYLGPWQWAWADRARQAAFEERDAIFDMAHAGQLSFGSEDYETIRASFNALIRFAHRISAPRLLFHIAMSRSRVTPLPQLYAALDRIDDQSVRRAVLGHVQRAETVVISSIMARSLITALLVGLFLFGQDVYLKLAGASNRVRLSDVIEKAGRIVQVEAESICAA